MPTLASAEARAALVSRLGRLRPESTRGWGRMSAPAMLCHLADAFRMVSGEKAAVFRGNVFTRTVLKPLALYAPFPWPRGIPTSSEIAPEGGGTRPGDFYADRDALIALIERAWAAPDDEPRPAHPLFGSMSKREWLRFGWLHFDHHLRQFRL